MVPVADTPFWAAIRSVKSGKSGRAGLAAARAKGLHIADATWYQMVGEVRRSLSSQLDEVTRPLGQRPGQHEIQGFQAKNARGFMQYVDVMVRDRATGVVSVRPYSVRTNELLRRGQVINRALKSFQGAVDTNKGEYDEQVLGAVYTATYQFVPEA
jgi:hypothetical protein